MTSQAVFGENMLRPIVRDIVRLHKTVGTTVVEHFMAEENIIVLEDDVSEYFPDSETVNKALRSLILLIPKRTQGQHELNI
jgi:hypothetical protein